MHFFDAEVLGGDHWVSREVSNRAHSHVFPKSPTPLTNHGAALR